MSEANALDTAAPHTASAPAYNTMVLPLLEYHAIQMIIVGAPSFENQFGAKPTRVYVHADDVPPTLVECLGVQVHILPTAKRGQIIFTTEPPARMF